MAKTRISANLSAEALAIVATYQAKNKIKDRGTAIDLLILEFGGAHPPPEPEPTKYDVEISQAGGYVLVRKGTALLLSAPKSDAANAFHVAVEAVPPDGSLGIGEGTYELEALYPFGLDADGSNIFYSCIPIIDKQMHIHGAGVGKTTIKLAPWQRSASRHVAMMLIRSTGPMAPGYTSFSLEGITFDGNAKYQYAAEPHDGEALLLIGSEGKGGIFRDLEFRNSYGSGFYRGNNGSGSGSNELIQNVVARNCADKGIMLDTCCDSRVVDCEAWACQDGLCLYGNDDWQTRGPDQVTARGFKTDSQIVCWQVNEFTLSDIEMDCSKAKGAYGLVVRDGSGVVMRSSLKNDHKKKDSAGGATYIYEAARVSLEDCQLEGWFGIHAIGSSQVEAIGCRLEAFGGCYCTTDGAPVSSSIKARRCSWSGKKSDLAESSSLSEE
jgi:hypothetical protein